MTSSAIINAILMLGVVVMIVAPLVWAIATQHRDHSRHLAATEGAKEPQSPRVPGRDRRHAQRPQYQPVAGRA